jgi:peptidoglycan/xylan/chitin deacetylase (PgdA/CDA1 family)
MPYSKPSIAATAGLIGALVASLTISALSVHAAQAATPDPPGATFCRSLEVRDVSGRPAELRVTCVPDVARGGRVRLTLPGGFPAQTRVSQVPSHLDIVVPGFTVGDGNPDFTVGRAGVESFAMRPLSQAIGGLKIDFSCAPGTKTFVDFKPGQGALSFTVKTIEGAPTHAVHRVALTFDDFPFPAQSGELLAVLRKYDIPATLFCIGWKVEMYPDLVRQAQQQGLSIQNHTYSHIPLATVSDEKVTAELTACNAAIEKVTGVKPRFFRPAGSSYDAHVFSLGRKIGLIPVGWTVNVHDYNEPDPTFIANHVIDGVNGNTIVLLHDGVHSTVEALPRIIETLAARGYQFVTVDDMYGGKGTGGE